MITQSTNKVSSDNKYSTHFRAARTQLGLTQNELADALLLSRNYIAQIETGKREPSVRVLSALDSFVDKKRAQSTRPPDYVVSENESEVFGITRESQGYFKPVEKSASRPAAAIRAKITKHVDELLLAAGDDVQRLGWIAEQLVHHVSEPVHWGMHERINQQVLSEERLRDQQEKARIKGQKTQGSK